MRTSSLPIQLLAVALLFTTACNESSETEPWYPPVREITEAPVLTPEESLDSLVVPPDFRVEIAAAEPLVEDPIAIDIDPDGRMWVVEMRGFMTDLVDPSGDYQPVGRVKVLQDVDNDGRMDRQTVFLDSLVLPRSVLVLNDGVLVAEPPALEALTRSDDSLIQKQAARLAERIVWPGKRGYEAPDEPLLTAEEKDRIARGEILYQQTCATCHQSNGRGREGVSASLVDSPWVLGRERSAVRIILDGKEGDEELMPAHRDRLNDEEVAAVASYIRRAWGNEAAPVEPATVADVRKATAPRGRPWTDEELELMVH